MKTLFAIMLCTVAGCASAQAAVRPGEAAAIHAHVVSMQGTVPAVRPDVTPDVTPSTRCDGSGKIRMPDGNTADCPGCSACKNREPQPLIQPAVYERITKVTRQAIVPTDPDNCVCVQATGSCACAAVPTILPASGTCSDGSCAAPTKRTTASGSCASGSCGSSAGESRGPVRKFIKARPVRRLFGRLFRR